MERPRRPELISVSRLPLVGSGTLPLSLPRRTFWATARACVCVYVFGMRRTCQSSHSSMYAMRSTGTEAAEAWEKGKCVGIVFVTWGLSKPRECMEL